MTTTINPFIAAQCDQAGEIVMLCNDPVQPVPTERKPLSELERMKIISDEFPLPLVQSVVIQKIDSVCLAIEAAHGIKGGET